MTARDEFVLAVDCGSTNMKAAVFDRHLSCLGSSSVPLVYSVNDGVCVEVPAESVWSGFVSLCLAACSCASVEWGQIGTVSLGSQAQTFSVVDAGGQARMPFISWMDRRAVAESREIGEAVGQSFHCHCSFAACMPQLQLAKVLWVRRHWTHVFAEKNKIVSLPGYLAIRMGAENGVDRNLAAMGGLYSLGRGEWWEETLEICEVAPSQLGSLVDVGGAVGEVQDNGAPLSRAGLHIVLAGNDQTAGAYGNGCDGGGLVVTLGTALVAYRYAGAAAGPFHSGGCWGPYPGGGFYELATRDEGCRAQDWAMRELVPHMGPREFDNLASATWEDGIDRDCPLFFPARIHRGDAWCGRGNPASQAYAVLEGIAFSLKELIENDLDAGSGLDIITAVGGGSRSALWLDIIANALACPVIRGHGDALRGAAAMALGVKLDPRQDLSGASLPTKKRHEELMERYELWQSKQ